MRHYAIREDRLRDLLRANTKLAELEAQGVDNWEGYSEIDWDAINRDPDLTTFQEVW